MTTDTVEIPSPRGWPIVGNLLQIPRSRLTQHLLQTSRDFEGIFQLNLAGRRVPFIYSAELVAELCDQTRFRKVVAPPLSFLRNMTGDGLFTAQSDNPNWGKAHRIILSAFSQSAMKSYFDQMREVAEQLITKWEQQGPNKDITVTEDMTRFTLESVAQCCFGYSFKLFESEHFHPFLEAMSRTLNVAMARVSEVPHTRFLRPRNKQNERDIATMSALVDELILQRRQAPSNNDDLLNRMLNSVDPKTGEKLDDLNIRYQVITFLIAGHETTSGMLSFALSLLLRHPDILEQAYAEVDRILPGDTVPEYEHIAKLNVLERVLKETLRLWPTAPALVVAPYEDTLIGGRYRIARDQWTTVILPALHRDPKVWDDPESFNIDRFLPENEAKLRPSAYLPFGIGQRACLGRRFALTESKLVLALILQRFVLSDPHHYQFKIKETLSLKADNLRIRARRRAVAIFGKDASLMRQY